MKSILNDRTVGIICPGPSLWEMDENIERFRCLDFCWVSINNYPVVHDILHKIGKRVEIVTAYPLELQKTWGDLLTLKKPSREPIGNSLFEFLYALSLFGKRRVFLFGADGSVVNKQHYKEECHRLCDVLELHKNTEQFNQDFPQDAYGLDIINCSINSKYEPFPKITYEEFLRENCRCNNGAS